MTREASNTSLCTDWIPYIVQHACWEWGINATLFSLRRSLEYERVLQSKPFFKSSADVHLLQPMEQVMSELKEAWWRQTALSNNFLHPTRTSRFWTLVPWDIVLLSHRATTSAWNYTDGITVRSKVCGYLWCISRTFDLIEQRLSSMTTAQIWRGSMAWHLQALNLLFSKKLQSWV